LEERGWDVHVATSLAEAETVLAGLRAQLDTVLLDRVVPDGDATALIPKIRASHPNAGIAIVSAHIDDELALSSQAQGVYVVPKPVKLPVLCRLVEHLVDAGNTDDVDRYASAVGLSPRERAVLCLAVSEMGGHEIAGCLDCTIRTVETYWQRIFDKTGKRSQRAVLAAVIRANNNEVG